MLDAEAYFEWAQRSDTDIVAHAAVGYFVALLVREPCVFPSVPIAEDSKVPIYEVREAVTCVGPLPEYDVWIRYLHVYATGDVVILDVRNRDKDQ